MNRNDSNHKKSCYQLFINHVTLIVLKNVIIRNYSVLHTDELIVHKINVKFLAVKKLIHKISLLTIALNMAPREGKHDLCLYE